MSSPLPPILDWSRRLQAMAQTGLTFTKDPYDIERYEAIREMAAEMAAQAGIALDPASLVDLMKAETGYATPRVDVRAVVFADDGRLLLVRERSDGLWTLPGGWADVGVSPAENVEREVLEESGFRVRAAKVLAVYDRDKHAHPSMMHHVYKLCLRCEITGGEAAVNGTSETTGVDFFAEDQIPDLSTGRTTAAQIRRFFEHYRSPDLPTDFD